MIVDQLRIATNIVVITYAALVGAVALGMALKAGAPRRRQAAGAPAGRIGARVGAG